MSSSWLHGAAASVPGQTGKGQNGALDHVVSQRSLRGKPSGSRCPPVCTGSCLPEVFVESEFPKVSVGTSIQVRWEGLTGSTPPEECRVRGRKNPRSRRHSKPGSRRWMHKKKRCSFNKPTENFLKMEFQTFQSDIQWVLTHWQRPEQGAGPLGGLFQGSVLLQMPIWPPGKLFSCCSL